MIKKSVFIISLILIFGWVAECSGAISNTKVDTLNSQEKLPTFSSVGIELLQPPQVSKVKKFPNPVLLHLTTNIILLFEKKNLFKDVIRNTNDARYIFQIAAYELNNTGCGCSSNFLNNILNIQTVFIKYQLIDAAREDRIILYKMNNPPIRKYAGFEEKEADKIFQDIKQSLEEYRPILFKVANNPSMLKGIVIGIIPFFSSGQSAESQGLGETFAAMLTTYFTSNKWLKVAEREEIKNILKELKIGYTGLIVPSTAKKAGKMLGVDYFITGNITQLNDKIEMDMKIISVETGEIIFSDYDSIRDVEKLRFLADDTGYKILKYFVEHKNK